MELKDFSTLAEAQAHTKTTGRKISPDMMLAFLTQFNLIDLLDTPADRANTPKTKEAKGLRHAFGFGSEFNLIKDDPASVLPLLTQMQVDGLIPQDFIDFCVGYANPSTKPYENRTQADWDRAQGLMVYTSEIQQQKGFIKLAVSADCEAHRPQIFATVQGIKTQVGTAPEISKAGEYLARVPANHSSYVVENSYGAIS